jgi:Protein of unknown function (DUF2778)
MTEGVYEDYDGIRLEAPAFGRSQLKRALPGVAVAASSVFLLYWAVCVRPSLTPARPPAVAAKDARPAVSPFGELAAGSGLLRLDAVSQEELGRFGSLAASQSAGAVAAPADRFSLSEPYGDLCDLQASVSMQSLALRRAFEDYGDGEPAPAEGPVVASVPINPPLPPRRPSIPGAGPAPAPSTEATAPAAEQGPEAKPAIPDVSGMLARLFTGVGKPPAGVGATTGSHVVAYAAPETTTVGRTSRDDAILRNLTPSAPPGALARYDRFTAVYDIAARTLYMPNGARIEAHSGYGDLKDDPKHVNVHALGATPPDVYELTMRESLFHGVQALRLKPLGQGEQFGRTGLLAHPYMLGEGGDSNGCVSVKDYDAFLQAFESGQVKKLAVVAKLD